MNACDKSREDCEGWGGATRRFWRRVIISLILDVAGLALGSLGLRAFILPDSTYSISCATGLLFWVIVALVLLFLYYIYRRGVWRFFRQPAALVLLSNEVFLIWDFTLFMFAQMLADSSLIYPVVLALLIQLFECAFRFRFRSFHDSWRSRLDAFLTSVVGSIVGAVIMEPMICPERKFATFFEWASGTN